MPNVKELQTIVDYGRFQPAMDPIFGPRSSLGYTRYWSSTTFALHESFAQFVSFDSGEVSSDGKLLIQTFYGPGLPVRAVRDGQCRPR